MIHLADKANQTALSANPVTGAAAEYSRNNGGQLADQPHLYRPA